MLLLVFVVVAWLLTKASFWALLVAALAVWVLFKIGFAMLSGLAQPVPDPPPAGELRKVKILYRCTICGTEVRMTTANDQMPEPPRHCMDEMELVTPVDDLSRAPARHPGPAARWRLRSRSCPQAVDNIGESNTLVTSGAPGGHPADAFASGTGWPS